MYEAFTTPQLEETFHTQKADGLSSAEAAERLRQSGENILKKGKEQTILDMVMEQLNDHDIHSVHGCRNLHAPPPVQ